MKNLIRATIAVFLLIGAILLFTGCTRVDVVQTPPPVDYATAASTAVRLIAKCNGEVEGFGSATVIGPYTAVTAAHMLCDDKTAESTYDAILADGGVVPMVAGEVAPDGVDVMLLQSEGGKFEKWAPIASGDPARWEHVFGVTGDGGFYAEGGEEAFPAFYLKHGWVAQYDYKTLWVSQHCVPGNSGSGWFNERGELLGVLSAGVWNQGLENFCMGYRPAAWLSLVAP